MEKRDGRHSICVSDHPKRAATPPPWHDQPPAPSQKGKEKFKEKARRAKAKARARINIGEDRLDSVGTFVHSPRKKGDKTTMTPDNIGGDKLGQKAIRAVHYATY